MARYVVTGGAGFIGSHLVERVVARGDTVCVLDDFSTGKLENLKEVQSRIQIIEASVTDNAAVRHAIKNSQAIFHFAALPSVERSLEDPVATHAACATGTLNVLEAARRAGTGRVVYAASSSAYGGLPGIVRREDDAVCPLSPYAAAKLAGEHYCQSYTRSYGLETVCLRFFNVFGPRQDAGSPYAGVIPLFLETMRGGRPPTIDGDGLQSRDFTYVDNAVDAALKAAKAPGVAGKVYNVGLGGRTSILELVQRLNELLGVKITPVHGRARPGDVRHSQADISRARRELGYEPTVTFEEGLRRTFQAAMIW